MKTNREDRTAGTVKGSVISLLSSDIHHREQLEKQGQSQRDANETAEGDRLCIYKIEI